MDAPLIVTRKNRGRARERYRAAELLAVSAEDISYENVTEVHAAAKGDVNTLCGEPTTEFTAAWFDPDHDKSCKRCVDEARMQAADAAAVLES